MAINFPTSLDNFTNPSSGNTLDSPSHSLQHSDINDAVEAMQRKVGVGTAVAGSASAGQVLTISAAGTSTWSTPTPTGFVQIVPSSVSVASGSGSASSNGRVTFTGATGISLNSVFSSTYTNYRIVGQLNVSSPQDYYYRLRTGTTDNATSNYRVGRYYVGQESSLAAGSQNNITTGEVVIGTLGTTKNSFFIEIANPQQTDYTTSSSVSSGYYAQWVNGSFIATTSFDGITIFSGGSGTMSGTFSIYGYN